LPEDEGRALADLLLRRARADAVALEKLADDAEIDDAIVGFHAQQAVEKSVKAVLARHSIDFPFVHDIARLLRLLEEASVDPPPNADEAIELSPWAAELRYGEILGGRLDRERLRVLVRDVIAWAESTLTADRGAETDDD
jgi:HEPN domain-containing protein